MAEHRDAFIGHSKKIAGLGITTLAAAVMTLGIASGTAHADDLKADPTTPSAGPVANKGIRTQAIQGELRTADKGVAQAQSVDVRGSNIGVPTVKADSPPPGNLAAEIGYDCLFAWSQFCK